MSGAFKLGKMTLNSLFSKPATTSYPAQPAQYYPDTRGQIHNDIDKCIFCGTCTRNCPSDSLSIDKDAYIWSINRFSCVQCGCCVRVCPTKCLSMEIDYTPSAEDKRIDDYVVSNAEKAKRDAEKRAKAERQAKLREEALAKKKAAAEAAAKAKAQEQSSGDQQ